MKQILLSRLFLFLLLFLTWLDLAKFSLIPAGKIGEPTPIFPQLQINLLKSKNASIVNDTVQETKDTLLHYFLPELIEESWETSFVFTDLLAGEEPEVIFGLSLPPDRGVLILLQKNED